MVAYQDPTSSPLRVTVFAILVELLAADEAAHRVAAERKRCQRKPRRDRGLALAAAAADDGGGGRPGGATAAPLEDEEADSGPITRAEGAVVALGDLSRRLRVPAISRLQKLHNVEVALDALRGAGALASEPTRATRSPSSLSCRSS